MSATSDDQVEETVQRLAELHHRHYQSAGPIQRVAGRITSVLSRPGSVLGALLFALLWMCGNLLASHFGRAAVDPPPFADMDLAATVIAFLSTLLILTTQRHEGELANRRAQLTLQIAVLSERKLAKVIELLEEQRRDNPMLQSRIDEEAERLARPSDPVESLDLIEATHREGA